MVNIPKNVLDKISASGTVKALVTASLDGQPHAIVCGSIISPSPDKIIVGEVLMKKSVSNIEKNKKASIMISSGMEAYEIIVSNPVRVAKGPMLDQMNNNLAKVHLKANAIWTFDVCSVYNESASPEAGTKIA